MSEINAASSKFDIEDAARELGVTVAELECAAEEVWITPLQLYEQLRI